MTEAIHGYRTKGKKPTIMPKQKPVETVRNPNLQNNGHHKETAKIIGKGFADAFGMFILKVTDEPENPAVNIASLQEYINMAKGKDNISESPTPATHTQHRTVEAPASKTDRKERWTPKRLADIRKALNLQAPKLATVA